MPPTPYVKRPIIKDDAVFSFNYVPPELPHREKQLAQLHSLFGQVVRGGIPQTAFITGPVGTGKTALAKRFCAELEEQGRLCNRGIVAELVNCRNRDSPPEILHRLITARFQEHLEPRGFSVAQLLNILRLKLVKNKVHIVVVLDEANALIKRSGPDLVYNLSRFDEDSGGAQGLVSLILISQLNVWEFLDLATASTFKRTNTVTLGPYDKDELFDILAMRARLGLYPGTWSGEVLELSAQLAATEGGDARRAIETLHAAARHAQDEGLEAVRPDLIEGASAAQDGGLPLERLDGLEPSAQLILLAIARAGRRKAFITTGEAEKAYQVVCEERGQRPVAHTQFWKYIQLLEGHGIIDKAVEKDGRTGTTTRISPHDVTAEGLEKMVLTFLERPGARRRA
jgi:cell division control protein 6